MSAPPGCAGTGERGEGEKLHLIVLGNGTMSLYHSARKRNTIKKSESWQKKHGIFRHGRGILQIQITESSKINKNSLNFGTKEYSKCQLEIF
jgi:hypothetical protein